MQNEGSSEQEVDVMRRLKAMYSTLLTGPLNMALPQMTNSGANQPEGQRLLTDSINFMREKHVEFQVPAQHDLIKVSFI